MGLNGEHSRIHYIRVLVFKRIYYRSQQMLSSV